jgi:hypothetical protein
MKQINLLIFTFLIFSTPVYAGVFAKPKLHAIKGKISSNLKKFDLSRLTIKESLICHQGWGDGRSTCGTKSLEAQVNSNGQFTLPELQGPDTNWGSAYYEVYLNGQHLLGAPYELNAYDNNESIKKLLENFTLYFIDSYEVHLTTDIGTDFDEWLKINNNHNGISYVVSILNTNSDQSLKEINKILPNQYKNIGIDKNHFTIAENVFLIPGDLASIKENYNLSITIGSKYMGDVSSVDIFQKKILLDDLNLQDKISIIQLQTLLINYQLNGIWMFRPQIDLQLENSRVFIVADPVLVIESLCANNILSGTLRLLYIERPELNEIRKLAGTCKDGSAEFDLNFKVLAFDKPQNTYQLNSRFYITKLAGSGADADILDLSSNIKYHSYSSFEKCNKIRKEGKYYRCD